MLELLEQARETVETFSSAGPTAATVHIEEEALNPAKVDMKQAPKKEEAKGEDAQVLESL
jgi:hypothetical protein